MSRGRKQPAFWTAFNWQNEDVPFSQLYVGVEVFARRDEQSDWSRTTVRELRMGSSGTPFIILENGQPMRPVAARKLLGIAKGNILASTVKSAVEGSRKRRLETNETDGPPPAKRRRLDNTSRIPPVSMSSSDIFRSHSAIIAPFVGSDFNDHKMTDATNENVLTSVCPATATAEQAPKPIVLFGDLLDIIAKMSDHFTLLSLAELGIRFAEDWWAFSTGSSDFYIAYPDKSPFGFWRFLGAPDNWDSSNADIDHQFLQNVKLEHEIGRQCFEFPCFALHQRHCEDPETRYEEMCHRFEACIGPVRGVYHYLRHVQKRKATKILRMTAHDVAVELFFLNTPSFAVVEAATFYGLNYVAYCMFQRLNYQDADKFVEELETHAQGSNGFFDPRTNQNDTSRSDKIRAMLGHDLFGYMYLHGNVELAKEISRKFGDENGVVCGTNQESVFAKRFDLLLSTLRLESWKWLLGNRFCHHFVNQGSPLLAVCELFVDATNVSKFNALVSLLNLTGSASVRKRVEERLNCQFGVSHLVMLEKYVYSKPWLQLIVDQGFQFGCGNRKDFEKDRLRVCQRYPYQYVQMDYAARREVLDQTWVQVRAYMEEKGYFEKHSKLHTAVFRDTIV